MTLPTVYEVMGENLRRCREAKHLTREELAAELDEFGMPWTYQTVVAFERGERQLAVHELFELSAAAAIPISELFAGDGRLRLGAEMTSSREALRELLADDPAPSRDAFRPIVQVMPGAQGFYEVRPSEVRLSEAFEMEHRYRWPGLTFQEYRDARRCANHDAEQKAATKLGIAPMDVAVAALSLWGRSLSDERDARVRDRTDPGASARSVQALRGHVTRQLLAELANHLKGGSDGVDQ